MSRRPGKRDIGKLACELHRCPEGYEGPCWGPTVADRVAARDALLASLAEETKEMNARTTPDARIHSEEKAR